MPDNTRAFCEANGAIRLSAAYRAISTRRWTQTFIVIADYQVLTDRETADNVAANVREIVLDYLAAGLDPDNGR